MTRDETVALFLECEAKRAEALAAGKNEDEAHEFAKDHWNNWAVAMLADRKVLENSGVWNLLPRNSAESRRQWRQKHSEAMQKWLDLSRADFSRLQISARIFGLLKNEDLHYGRCADPEQPIWQLRAAGYWIDFRGFIFPGEVDFTDTEFRGPSVFEYCQFTCVSWFRNMIAEDMRFNHATFSKAVWFRGSTINDDICFVNVIFEDHADFGAVWVKRTFDLGGAQFAFVPNFVQANFEEVPRLDNFRIIGRILAPPPRPNPQVIALSKSYWVETYYDRACSVWTWLGRAITGLGRRMMVADRGDPSRWRALKQLAIQGHDIDCELEFHGREVRSQRFADDWPIPWPVGEIAPWGGFFRFWLGVLYEIFSDFGRSVFRPFLTWLIGILTFAAFYLSQTEVMQRELALQDASYIAATVQTGRYALSNSVPCFASLATPSGDATPTDPSATKIGGLSETLRSQTNARAEALHLAFRNAFLVLDGGSDSAHRMYGCLYGLEMYAGQNPVPIVPSAVSTASAIQKLISGVLLFLFGLALRNMLKVK